MLIGMFNCVNLQRDRKATKEPLHAGRMMMSKCEAKAARGCETQDALIDLALRNQNASRPRTRAMMRKSL